MPSQSLILFISSVLSVFFSRDGSAGALVLVQTNKRIQHHRRCSKATLGCARPHAKHRSAGHSPPDFERHRSPSTPLFAGSPDVGAGGETASAPPSSSPVAPWIRTLAVFGLGYGLGGALAPGWRRHERAATRIGLSKVLLAFFVLRDAWRSTPPWAKPRIARYGRKFVNLVRAFVRLGDAIEMEVDGDEDLDDITSFSNFATKIQGVVSAASF